MFSTSWELGDIVDNLINWAPQVAGRWMTALQTQTEWFPISDQLDKLFTTCLCKIAFDRDVPFTYGEDTHVYRMVQTCFDGIKDKLFNPLGCTVR